MLGILGVLLDQGAEDVRQGFVERASLVLIHELRCRLGDAVRELVRRDVDDVGEAAEDLAVPIAVGHDLVEEERVEESRLAVLVVMHGPDQLLPAPVDRVPAQHLVVKVVCLLELVVHVLGTLVVRRLEHIPFVRQFVSREAGEATDVRVWDPVVVEVDGQASPALAVPDRAAQVAGSGSGLRRGGGGGLLTPIGSLGSGRDAGAQRSMTDLVHLATALECAFGTLSHLLRDFVRLGDVDEEIRWDDGAHGRHLDWLCHCGIQHACSNGI